MHRHLQVILIQILEHHDALSLQQTPVHFELHVHCSGRALCSEGRFCGHFFTVFHHRFSGIFIHERAFQLICPALLQTFIAHCVHDGDFSFRLSVMRPGAPVPCLRPDLDTVIRQCPQRDRHRILIHADSDLQQLHAFVGITSLLCDLIVIIYQCTFRIIRICRPEPDPVFRRLTGVGVMAVSVPLRSSACISVLIRHDGVALPCSQRCDRERHARQSLKVSVRHLHKFEIPALHLLRCGLCVIYLHGLLHSCRDDVCCKDLIGQTIPLRCLHLSDTDMPQRNARRFAIALIVELIS